jgi:NitT/TauT family transport system ATP-binding protein
LIKVAKVSKKFPDGTEALREVSLEVKDGEFFSIVGPSGCGKSTLLRLIAGLEEPSSGQVEAPQSLAMVFQAGALIPWQTTLENATFGLRMHGLPNADKIGREKIEQLGLKGLEDRYPRELSGGQRQRVGIARALAVSPPGLLLDEPFSALDTFTSRKLQEDLLKIWKVSKMTVILVSHSIEDAVELADQVAVMKEGRVVEVVNVSLPRPRSRNDKLFTLVSRIEKMLS